LMRSTVVPKVPTWTIHAPLASSVNTYCISGMYPMLSSTRSTSRTPTLRVGNIPIASPLESVRSNGFSPAGCSVTAIPPPPSAAAQLDEERRAQEVLLVRAGRRRKQCHDDCDPHKVTTVLTGERAVHCKACRPFSASGVERGVDREVSPVGALLVFRAGVDD